jgi:hypothetical protein
MFKASVAWLVPVPLCSFSFYNPSQICGAHAGATRLAWSARFHVVSELRILFVLTVALLVLLLKRYSDSRAGLRIWRFAN